MANETYLIMRVTGGGGIAFDPLKPYDLKDAVREPDSRVEVSAEALDDRQYHEARRDPGVAGMALPIPVQLIEPVAEPEAAAEPAQVHGATWGVAATGALQSPYVGHGVTVAVLDTGIDAEHEAFAGIELVQKDFTGEGNGDQHGHGTHVAGTIFGQSVQGLRYAVAPGVRRALIGKVIGTQSSATTKEIVDAIMWAIDEGAQIINMSLGFDFPGLVEWLVSQQDMPVDLATSKALGLYRDNIRFFDRLVDLLRARAAQFSSALLVAAAGNESKRAIKPDYTIEVAPPATAEGIVAVAALRSMGPPHAQFTVAPFSNIRAVVAAPGVGVYSARKGGGYTSKSGTSMASPHVAGVAALWAERQIALNGVVNVSALDAQLRGHTRQECLTDVSYLDVGEGLVVAPAN